MERLEFDKANLAEVSILEVKPNSWNPKVKATPEYFRVKQSIEAKGLRMPVVVREVDSTSITDGIYEIVDGEQRYTACKELGYSTILIYNLGKLSDKEAKELTIWFQQQVPFNDVDLIDYMEKYKTVAVDINLPYSSEEIDKFIEMGKFNWDLFDFEIGEEDPEYTELSLKMTKDQYSVVKDALEKAKENEDVLDNNLAMIFICKSFIDEDDNEEGNMEKVEELELIENAEDFSGDKL